MSARMTSCVGCLSVVALPLMTRAPSAMAQPDITVSRVGLTSPSAASDDFDYFGQVGGVRAFSIASTACNVGDQPAEFIDGSSGDHPVIAQNMYRLLNGRFEQIGMSWLTHTFAAVSEPTCGACQPAGHPNLGPGCADTYWAGLNGSQSLLGPRSQINPQGLGSGGTHTDPHASPAGNSILRGRLQITDADIFAGGRYFAEIQYVTHDETLAGRGNNASWREVIVTLTAISGVAPGQASVHMGEPAIFAWAANDPAVVVAAANIPGEGRFDIGSKVTDLGNGSWDYEYALHNLSSDRAAGSFSVPIPAGVTVLSTGFHDVAYHSGDGVGGVNFDGTDWPATQSGGMLTWATESFAANENANALRWGTLYNFRFTANAPPAPTVVNVPIGLFKPGAPPSVFVRAFVPSADTVPINCALVLGGDMNNDASVDGLDIGRFSEVLINGGASELETCAGDVAAPPDGVIDLNDLTPFVTCLLAGGCP